MLTLGYTISPKFLIFFYYAVLMSFSTGSTRVHITHKIHQKYLTLIMKVFSITGLFLAGVVCSESILSETLSKKNVDDSETGLSLFAGGLLEKLLVGRFLEGGVIAEAFFAKQSHMDGTLLKYHYFNKQPENSPLKSYL